MKEIMLDHPYFVAVVPLVEYYRGADDGPHYRIAKWSEFGEKNAMIEAQRMMRPLGYFRDWVIVETWVSHEESEFKTSVQTKLLKTRYFKSLI